MPILAILVDAAGRRLTASDNVRVVASMGDRSIKLKEKAGLWRGTVVDLKAGDYRIDLISELAVKARTHLQIRVTDGVYWQYDSKLHLFRRGSKVPGPLSGSYQGNVFACNVGLPNESLIQGQKDWDRWDRSQSPGEHLFYWEALTSAEMDERFGYLASCGWDLLHVCQHWGMSNLYAAFNRRVLGKTNWPDESWIGSEFYRIRLRDSMYLGLVHRLPKMVTWDEQVAEDEHRLITIPWHWQDEPRLLRSDNTAVNVEYKQEYYNDEKENRHDA